MPPARDGSMHAVALFVKLLAEDSNWRNKLLKIIQYAAKLLALTPASAAVATQLASTDAIVVEAKRLPTAASLFEVVRLLHAAVPPPARLKDVAKHLSLARRIMLLGDGIVYARDLVAAVHAATRGGTASMAEVDWWALVGAALNATSGAIEDVNTASKIGLVDAKALPAAFPRAVNMSWAAVSTYSLIQAVRKWRATHGKLASLLRRVCESPSVVAAIYLPPLGSAPFTHALATLVGRLEFEDALDVAACDRARADAYAAALNVAKCVCDCGQSVPAALELKGVPEWLDVSFGLWSGVIACLRVWEAARVKERACLASSVSVSQPRTDAPHADEGGPRTAAAPPKSLASTNGSHVPASPPSPPPDPGLGLDASSTHVKGHTRHGPARLSDVLHTGDAPFRSPGAPR